MAVVLFFSCSCSAASLSSSCAEKSSYRNGLLGSLSLSTSSSASSFIAASAFCCAAFRALTSFALAAALVASSIILMFSSIHFGLVFGPGCRRLPFFAPLSGLSVGKSLPETLLTRPAAEDMSYVITEKKSTT